MSNSPKSEGASRGLRRDSLLKIFDKSEVFGDTEAIPEFQDERRISESSAPSIEPSSPVTFLHPESYQAHLECSEVPLLDFAKMRAEKRGDAIELPHQEIVRGRLGSSAALYETAIASKLPWNAQKDANNVEIARDNETTESTSSYSGELDVKPVELFLTTALARRVNDPKVDEPGETAVKTNELDISLPKVGLDAIKIDIGHESRTMPKERRMSLEMRDACNSLPSARIASEKRVRFSEKIEVHEALPPVMEETPKKRSLMAKFVSILNELNAGISGLKSNKTTKKKEDSVASPSLTANRDEDDKSLEKLRSLTQKILRTEEGMSHRENSKEGAVEKLNDLQRQLSPEESPQNETKATGNDASGAMFCLKALENCLIPNDDSEERNVSDKRVSATQQLHELVQCLSPGARTSAVEELHKIQNMLVSDSKPSRLSRVMEDLKEMKESKPGAVSKLENLERSLKEIGGTSVMEQFEKLESELIPKGERSSEPGDRKSVMNQFNALRDDLVQNRSAKEMKEQKVKLGVMAQLEVIQELLKPDFEKKLKRRRSLDQHEMGTGVMKQFREILDSLAFHPRVSMTEREFMSSKRRRVSEPGVMHLFETLQAELKPDFSARSHRRRSSKTLSEEVPEIEQSKTIPASGKLPQKASNDRTRSEDSTEPIASLSKGAGNTSVEHANTNNLIQKLKKAEAELEKLKKSPSNLHDASSISKLEHEMQHLNKFIMERSEDCDKSVVPRNINKPQEAQPVPSRFSSLSSPEDTVHRRSLLGAISKSEEYEPTRASLDLKAVSFDEERKNLPSPQRISRDEANQGSHHKIPQAIARYQEDGRSVAPSSVYSLNTADNRRSQLSTADKGKENKSSRSSRNDATKELPIPKQIERTETQHTSIPKEAVEHQERYKAASIGNHTKPEAAPPRLSSLSSSKSNDNRVPLLAATGKSEARKPVDVPRNAKQTEVSSGDETQKLTSSESVARDEARQRSHEQIPKVAKRSQRDKTATPRSAAPTAAHLSSPVSSSKSNGRRAPLLTETRKSEVQTDAASHDMKEVSLTEEAEELPRPEEISRDEKLRNEIPKAAARSQEFDETSIPRPISLSSSRSTDGRISLSATTNKSEVNNPTHSPRDMKVVTPDRSSKNVPKSKPSVKDEAKQSQEKISNTAILGKYYDNDDEPVALDKPVTISLIQAYETDENSNDASLSGNTKERQPSSASTSSPAREIQTSEVSPVPKTSSARNTSKESTAEKNEFKPNDSEKAAVSASVTKSEEIKKEQNSNRGASTQPKSAISLVDDLPASMKDRNQGDLPRPSSIAKQKTHRDTKELPSARPTSFQVMHEDITQDMDCKTEKAEAILTPEKLKSIPPKPKTSKEQQDPLAELKTANEAIPGYPTETQPKRTRTHDVHPINHLPEIKKAIKVKVRHDSLAVTTRLSKQDLKLLFEDKKDVLDNLKASVISKFERIGDSIDEKTKRNLYFVYSDEDGDEVRLISNHDLKIAIEMHALSDYRLVLSTKSR